MFDPLDAGEVHEAHRLSSMMVDLALELDGTCTGEHGIGVGKQKYLKKELGVPAIRAMHKIKHSLDPNETLNPDKVMPKLTC